MRYFPILRYLFVLSVILCTACGTALPTVKPYKLDVQQGNVVTSKMLLQLRPGMTKSQVRFIMGTPLLQDSFHGNRWDYVYQLRENGKIIEQRRVILDFENELLKSVRGDVVPVGSDKAKAPEEAGNTGTRVVEPTKPEEKGMLDKLKFWEKNKAKKDAAKIKAEESAAPMAAPTELTSPQDSANAPNGEAKPGEQKSILAVPMDVAPSPVPTENAPAETAPPQTEPVQAQPAETKSEAPVVAPAPEPAQAPAIQKAPEAAVETAPADSAAAPSTPAVPDAQPAYEPTSGMVFDKNLKSVPEEVAPEVKPAPPAPRAGNKTPPPPKDLPPEGSPSFFDRMLEKIGF